MVASHDWEVSERHMVSSSRIHYDLDIEMAERAIAMFNQSPCMQASESLIAHSFRDFREALCPDGVHARVALLDGLWGTQLFREGGSADRIAENLAANSDALINQIGSLTDVRLADDPTGVYAVAAQVLPVVLDHTPDADDKYRQNYSFASKFFHWCARDWFPIVDAKARKAINDLQRRHNVSPRVRSDTAAMGNLTYLQEYQRWIAFYSDVLDGLGDDEVARLRRADHDSQRTAYRVENTTLRILDKVFYIMGGGSALGRIVGDSGQGEA